MTDRELADAAWAELTKTTDSYPTWKRKGFPASSHWAHAKAFLDQIGTAPPPPPPPTAGVFVSPTGSDTSGDGSQLKPYATLDAARRAMQRGGPQVCYVRGGTYAIFATDVVSGTTYGLRLTAADSGQTYKAFQDEPAVLDGGSTNATSGLHVLLCADGASHVTFEGLDVQHFRWVGIGSHGGTNFLQPYPVTTGEARGNTIRRCKIHDGGYDLNIGNIYGAGPIWCLGRNPDLTIEENAVWNAPTAGIHANAGNGGSHCLDNLLIRGNAVTKVCQVVDDAGAIYSQDLAHDSINLRYFDNFVRDCGPGRGLYLDDGLCNATVAGNIVAGIFDIAAMIHGGRMNKWHNNLVDIEAFSTNGPRVMRFQGSSIPTDHAGNEWTNNIVISKAARWPVYWNDFPMLIRDNLYHTYAGAKIDATGDANPVWADPKLTGPHYTLAADSPAYAAPVSFQPLPTHWGPPGYVIPPGTPPSYV